MKTSLDLLSQVSVASPCSADWNAMRGDDHVRFCDHCEKNVYNLSALTTDAAINLIRQKEGKLCGRFFRRADGTMLTADCPVGVHHRILRKRKKMALLAVSLASFLGFSGCAKFEEPVSTSTSEPPAQQEKVEAIVPAPQVLQRPIAVAGGICAPKDMFLGKMDLPKNFALPGNAIAPELLPAPRVLELQSD